jgi:hypothetical protein
MEAPLSCDGRVIGYVSIIAKLLVLIAWIAKVFGAETLTDRSSFRLWKAPLRSPQTGGGGNKGLRHRRFRSHEAVLAVKRTATEAKGGRSVRAIAKDGSRVPAFYKFSGPLAEQVHSSPFYLPSPRMDGSGSRARAAP